MQRGRKSTANLVSLRPTGTRPRLTPPASLAKSERTIFTETAAAFPHLDQSDAPLLASFAVATCKAMKLSRGNDVGGWERAVRTQLALARSLRLTHQARSDPQTIGRRMADRRTGPVPWLDHGSDEPEADDDASD